MTAEKLLAQLQEDRECAKTWKQGTAMVRASEMIGRLTGLLVEKVEVKHELPSIIDAIEEGLARAGLPPHVTHQPPLIDITPTPAPAVADPFSD